MAQQSSEERSNQYIDEARGIGNGIKDVGEKAQDVFGSRTDKPSGYSGPKKGSNTNGPSTPPMKGETSSAGAPKAPQAISDGAGTAQNVANATGEATQAAVKTAGKVIAKGAEVGVRSTGAAATAGASEAVALPISAIKKAAEGLDQAKKVIKKGASSSKKATGKNFLLIVVSISVLLSSIFGGAAALIPKVVLNSLGVTSESKDTDGNKTKNKGILDFFNFGDEKSLGKDKFDNVEDYNSAMVAFTEVIYNYLEDSREEQEKEVKDHLKFTVNGETVEADYELTLANYRAQGSPFASVNIASILAAYSLSQGDLSEETLPKFERALKKAEKHMLHVSYSVTDENGNLYQQAEITPYPIYKYTSESRTLSGQGYIDYLRNFPEGHQAIRDAVVESINVDISGYQSQISTAQQAIGSASSIADKPKATKKEIALANQVISAAQSQINGAQSSINALNQQIADVNSGTTTATIGMIKASNIGSHTVMVYHVQADEKGEPLVDHHIRDENGAEDDRYVLYEGSSENVLDNTYAYVGRELIVPDVEYITYAQVTFEPYDSTDVFKMFDIDPDAIYKPSKKSSHPITNMEMYNKFYDVLEQTTAMANFRSIDVLSQYCTLSSEEIEKYLNMARNSGAHGASVSANRLQLIKTAIGLTGAVPYDLSSGKAKNPGWNDEWWQQTSYGYKGLDCSGFVQWAQWTAFDQDYQQLSGTGGISGSCEIISKNELMPGDFGVIFLGGSYGNTWNHTGIFVGYNDQGQMVWVHCNGSDKTVSVSENYTKFKVFLRNPSAIANGSDKWTNDEVTYGANTDNLDAMYVIAKSLLGESGVDDGFQACAEAVCNNVARSGKPVSVDTVLAKCTSKYYLEAYTRIFIKHDNYAGEPTAKHYQMVNKAISGKRDYITDPRVGYWRGRGMKCVPDGYGLFKQIPAGSGNFFLYSKK